MEHINFQWKQNFEKLFVYVFLSTKKEKNKSTYDMMRSCCHQPTTGSNLAVVTKWKQSCPGTPTKVVDHQAKYNVHASPLLAMRILSPSVACPARTVCVCVPPRCVSLPSSLRAVTWHASANHSVWNPKETAHFVPTGYDCRLHLKVRVYCDFNPKR